MATDWKLIRELMNSAIHGCEAAEALGLREEDRGRSTGTAGVAAWDVLVSAWTYPENTRYAVIRARHDLADDAPYRTELARAIQEAAGVCSELVGASKLDASLPDPAGDSNSVRKVVQRLIAWYPKHMIPQLERAAVSRLPSVGPPA